MGAPKITNSEIADRFYEMADLLEISNANPFRVRAYRNAARTIQDLSYDVAEMVKTGKDLSELPGVGKDLAGKISEIVKTGGFSALKEVGKDVPLALRDLLKVPSLGPKKAAVLYQKLGIKSLKQLQAAARKGKIQKLPRFGSKTEARILDEIKRLGLGESERLRLAVAEEAVDGLYHYMQSYKPVKKAIVAGSFRRRQDTIGDIDLLVTCKDADQVMGHFLSYGLVDRILAQGSTRSTVILKSGLQVDLRVVDEKSYGSALHYFTGSKSHNIAIRKLGLERGLKINEYGVFKGRRRVGGKTEQEVFAAVDLPYIEPELRENRGEIEAAREGRLPQLIEVKDLRGDLHAHTTATDGKHTLVEMANAAKQKGYAYLGITDHTQRVTVAKGMGKREFLAQIRQIDKLNEKLDGVTILKSAEVDILEDGSLDLPDEVLKELDYTVCSIHYKFNMSESKQTDRILKAMNNKHFNILGHPSGRLLGRRKPFAFDFERILKAAKECGCFLEINAQPERMDLTDLYARTAKQAGVKLAISTDAHSIWSLDYIQFGVSQARRGWIEKQDVINTRPLRQLRRLFRR